MTQRKKSNKAYIGHENLIEFVPYTPNQEKAYKAWIDGNHLVLSGSPGTGKTFLGMYFALSEVLSTKEYEKLVIMRSIVPTREMGFLPGSKEEKEEVFLSPYKSLAFDVTGDPNAWNKLTNNNKITFESTSFIRGMTFDNSIILVDEMQNLSFHELDSVITRIGLNTRIIFCGDYHQSDFTKASDKNGILEFLNILYHMKDVSHIKFGWEDIVRSDFVRDYIMTKEMIKDMENGNKK